MCLKTNIYKFKNLKKKEISGPIWATLVLFRPTQFIWSTSILFRPFWSTLILFGHIRPTLILFDSTQSTLVLFNPFWSYSITLIIFGPTQFTLNLFSPLHFIQSYLVYSIHSCPLWSNSVLFYHFGLFGSMRTTLVLFNPIQSTSVHSIHLVLFSPSGTISSTSVLFSQCWSNWIILVHFGLFSTFSPFLSFSIKRRRSESYINYPALTQAKLCTQRLSVMLSILQIKIDLVFRFGFEESSNRLIGYRTR